LTRRTPIPRPDPNSAIATMRRRSKASESAPPTKAMTINGTNSARLSRPTASVEWVSWKIWYGSAT